MLFSRRVFVGVCGAGPSGPLGRLGAGGDEAGELQLLLDGSWSSGTPISATISLKKPRTTRRRASISVMPRARR